MSYPLEDIKVKRLPAPILFSPALGAQLLGHAEDIVGLYRAGVAKHTGRLADSATAYVAVGGRRNDRLIGKVVVGTGLEYGVLHEFGSKRNTHYHAARELAEAVELWKGANRA